MPHSFPGSARRRAAAPLAVALAAATVALPAAAGAQSAPENRLGIAAGVAGVESAGAGIYLSGLIDHGLAARGRYVRSEGAIGWWPSRVNDRKSSNHIWSFGAALMQEVGHASVRPYAIVGAAVYFVDEREPLAGLNGGVGVRFRAGPTTMIAEARAHRRISAIGGRFFVPLTIGVTF